MGSFHHLIILFALWKDEFVCLEWQPSTRLHVSMDIFMTRQWIWRPFQETAASAGNVFNSVAPGNIAVILKGYFSNALYRIVAWPLAVKISVRWMPHNLTKEKSTLVQVMAWWRQAASQLLEPMYIQIYIIIWWSLGHIELISMVSAKERRHPMCDILFYLP